MIADKLTRWLTQAEQHQVSKFIADENGDAQSTQQAGHEAIAAKCG
ncbi:hypothetical protein ACVWXQ_001242 [Bradyrhizobium sp. S3.14.4]